MGAGRPTLSYRVCALAVVVGFGASAQTPTYKLSEGSIDCTRRIGSLFAAVATTTEIQSLAFTTEEKQVRGFAQGASATCSTLTGRLSFYRASAKESPAAAAPSRLLIWLRVDSTLRMLHAHGLISTPELDVSKERWNEIVTRESPDGTTPASEPKVVTSYITIPRVLSGLTVANSGVRIAVENDLTVSGIDLHWRELAQTEQSVDLGSADEAHRRFVEEHGLDARILQFERAYFDNGQFAAQSRYNPEWVAIFIYDPMPNKFSSAPVAPKRGLWRWSPGVQSK